MYTLITPNWQDYELIDSGNGKRLERYGPYILSRPDPQAIWKPHKPNVWKQAHARFEMQRGKGTWVKNAAIPQSWPIRYKNLTFLARLTPFKHTGIFPEQAAHWDFIMKKIAMDKKPKHVLNLFAYTGAATVAALAAGAKVTHVDASRQAIGYARENQEASGLAGKPVRYMLDDVMKFCTKELRRGVRYDGIVMDPPVYGHGPSGEKWSFGQMFPKLLDTCIPLLTQNPCFIIVNAYAVSASSIMLENTLSDYLKPFGGTITSGELALQETEGRLFSTGIYTRWERAS